MACAASTEANVSTASASPTLDEQVMGERVMGRRALTLHPQVALRPEPFGALAYHYDTRRLVFLKHPDVVRVVEALAHHETVDDAFDACGIEARRRPSFERALASLLESEMLCDRAG
jgi:putative mycofactocin binding protein MftB